MILMLDLADRPRHHDEAKIFRMIIDL